LARNDVRIVSPSAWRVSLETLTGNRGLGFVRNEGPQAGNDVVTAGACNGFTSIRRPIEGTTMNSRMRTIAMAAALAAAAAALGSRAADQGAAIATDAAAKPESVQHPAESKAPERARTKAAAVAPARVEQNGWWARERAEDDGYAWPLPPAPSRWAATTSPTPKVDGGR
jgi:hypothetical protein